MRLVTLALLAAGSLTVAAPAIAQDVYVGAGHEGVGVGVDIGPRHYRDRVYTERRYRDDDYAYARCHTTIIKRHGYTKRIRSCR